MKPKRLMLIAGEPSGDRLAAELVCALRRRLLAVETVYPTDLQPLYTGLEPRFFGAGGPQMKTAGVELAYDLTQHSVIGISEVLKHYFMLRRLFRQLRQMALERQPDVIIGVDYGGFNLRFGHAIKEHVRKHSGEFANWNPKLVQFVSPQVWASRPRRAQLLANDYDLVLCIFPFERDWYAQRVPKLRVEFLGHPMFDLLQKPESQSQKPATAPQVSLLPGSRPSELDRHLPVMLDAVKLIREKVPSVRVKTILPNEPLARLAKSLDPSLEIQVGNLAQALAETDAAIASTGTVTMECAFFGVPTVTLYKTSWSTYQIGRRFVTVKWITMPNILADEEIYPEFVQDAATAENISRAVLDLILNESRRTEIKSKLAKIVSSLGGSGAIIRAAKAIEGLLT